MAGSEKIRQRRVKVQEGIVFVHGIGRRKTQLQKSLDQLDQYLEKRKEYTKKLYTLGDRNSYSKTDPDATFMRMKEDAMLNGQTVKTCLSIFSLSETDRPPI